MTEANNPKFSSECRTFLPAAEAGVFMSNIYMFEYTGFVIMRSLLENLMRVVSVRW